MKLFIIGKHVFIIGSTFVLLLMCSTAYSQIANSGSNLKKEIDWSKTYKKLQKSVVRFDTPREERMGSGIVVAIGKDGFAYILTAKHVTEGYSKLLIRYFGEAGIIDTAYVHSEYYSDKPDMAIVVIKNPSVTLKVMDFCTKVPGEGSPVGAIGHPLGRSFTWTDGSITKIQGPYISHSAELKQGNSGGPLVNKYGLMVGMNTKVRLPEVVKIENPENPQDSLFTLMQGDNITLTANTINSSLENWLRGNENYKDKWKVKRYNRIWHNPIVYIGTPVVIGGSILYFILTSSTPEGSGFGEPPGVPY